MLIIVTETDPTSAGHRNLKSSSGFSPCYGLSLQRCWALEVSSDTVLDLTRNPGI